MDDLVKRLRDRRVCSLAQNSCRNDWVCEQAADRIEALEVDVKAVLRREEDANRAAMKHLRNLEQERIKSANYAAFSTEWRKKCEALEARVAAAYAYSAAATGETALLGQVSADAETHIDELLNKAYEEGRSEMYNDLRKRLVAADKLVEAGGVMARALQGNYIVPGSAAKWDTAVAAYEATKEATT